MKQSILFIVLIFTSIVSQAQNYPKHNNHNLSVKIDIPNSQLNVTDTIILSSNKMKVFHLNSNLTISKSNFEYKKVESLKGYTKYELTSSPNNEPLVIQYQGVIADNKDGLEHITHANMFESTSGIIFDKGIYLCGETYWVPDFEKAGLKTFSISVEIDKEWSLVSQGDAISEDETEYLKKYTFRMKHPTNQICLVGNKWSKYSETIHNVTINVYLINPDDNLAKRYLEVTSEYLALYGNLIGHFPYSKFDVIENFWETGYGLPSFTLLGKKVMRFPWILNTSYPHELLHNYWGNSVYVDYENGNWCEGITTYMADHLLKEKNNEDNLFRRAQLIKYTNYVNSDNDFPMSKFKSKTDAPSEAIGYSKVLMLNHMLRIKYGETVFLKSYADFYNTNKFETASFKEIKASFEKSTGDNLDQFFAQWVNSTGAPKIELTKVKLRKKKGKYTLYFDLKQVDTSSPFNLDIPVFIYLEGKETVERKLIQLNQVTQTYSLTFTKEPLRIDVDPLFDVMRILDAQEVPPTLSQILGSDKWVVILPKSSKDYFYYKNLAISWTNIYSKQGKEIEIMNDNKIEEIPTDCSVWVLGDDNIFAKELNIKELYKAKVDDEIFNRIDSLNSSETIVYTIPNNKNKNQAIGYLNSKRPELIGRLNMKFMHYSNFSYFGFEGKALENVLKGNFPALNSPLNYILTKETIDWSTYHFPEAGKIYK